MKLELDKETDVLYLRFDGSAVFESVEVRPGVILDFDEAGQIVGIKLLDVAKRVPADSLNDVSVSMG